MRSTCLALALLSVFMAIPGCGPLGKRVATDIGACAKGEVPGAVRDAVPPLSGAIMGTDDEWKTQLAETEAVHGVDFTVCAVVALLSDLTAPRTATPFGVPTDEEQKKTVAHRRAVDRARTYLSSRGVKT